MRTDTHRALLASDGSFSRDFVGLTDGGVASAPATAGNIAKRSTDAFRPERFTTPDSAAAEVATPADCLASSAGDRTHA